MVQKLTGDGEPVFDGPPDRFLIFHPRDFQTGLAHVVNRPVDGQNGGVKLLQPTTWVMDCEGKWMGIPSAAPVAI